ncbi:DUF4339 domain-containing protein [Paenibacillus cymbidii]|uniref:DUF4339 domain-containing protein n=1 Tax=Paenibacillus cymbidii TaxID=1639034 RepID=UPI001436C8CA|nr:DUF4339 domain-containing protein [Paenibacillus cymbidii]
MAETVEEWFHIENGVRKGPVNSSDMAELLRTRKITAETLVWKKGLSDWTPLAKTEFGEMISEPPPISGQAVNNTFVWWMVATPIIGIFVENIIMAVTEQELNYMATALAYFLVYSILCSNDQTKLKKAGHNTASFWWILFVPVYLFIRARKLRQFPLYAIIWCVCFVGSSAYSENIFDYFGVSSQTTINAVREGTFYDHPEMTIDEATKAYLVNPKWESFIAGDKQQYVNVSGIIKSSEDKLLIQFLVNSDRSFSVNALKINEQWQNVAQTNAFVDDMYAIDN